MEDSELKQVVFDEGFVSFRIPVDWVEDYRQSGACEYFDPTDTAALLRLDVALFRYATEDQPEGYTGVGFLTLISDDAGYEIHERSDGVAIGRRKQRSLTGGRPVVVHTWALAQRLTVNFYRLTTFSLTVLESHARDCERQALLAVLDREIQATELSPQVG